MTAPATPASPKSAAHFARIAVYVAPDGRSRSYPVPDGVTPASVHHWHGTPFTLTALLTTLPTAEVR